MELYSELILDLSRRPKNFGEIEHNLLSEGSNPLCGDRVKIFINLSNGIVESASFIGEGCAISMASASLMTSTIKGKSVTEIERIMSSFLSMVRGEPYDESILGKLKYLASVKNYSSRVKCATICWHALKKALR